MSASQMRSKPGGRRELLEADLEKHSEQKRSTGDDSCLERSLHHNQNFVLKVNTIGKMKGSELMELQIQDLVSSIRKEGVDAANAEAEAIISEAKKKAEAIIADAKAEMISLY